MESSGREDAKAAFVDSMTKQIRILWRVIAVFAIVSFILEVLGVSGYSFVWKYIWTPQLTIASTLYLAAAAAMVVFGMGTMFALIATRGKLQEDIDTGGDTTLIYWRKKRLKYMVGWYVLLAVGSSTGLYLVLVLAP